MLLLLPKITHRGYYQEPFDTSILMPPDTSPYTKTEKGINGLKSGKLLIGHDIDKVGVSKAVKETFTRINQVDRIWWVKKT